MYPVGQSMSTHEPKISVIIPTYQREKNIKRCLSSLSHQPPEDIEVIVVDDGTPPAVRVDTTGLAFPAHVLRQAHLGPGPARNYGARQARGPILLFLDDDCTLSENFIENCLLIFSDPKIAIVGAQIIGSPTDNLMEQIKNRRSRLYSPDNNLVEVDAISGCAYAMRKDIFNLIGGFDPAFYVHEDDDLSIRAQLKHIPIYRSPKLIVTHHLSFKKSSDFFEKAKQWSGEEDDMLFIKYKELLPKKAASGRIAMARERYLDHRSFLNLFILTMLSTGRLVKLPLDKWIGYRHSQDTARFRRSYYEFVWTLGSTCGYLCRYWRGWFFSFLKRFGMIYEVISHLMTLLFRRKPSQLVLFVTNRCQADCAHCFYYDKLNTSRNDLSLDEYDAISSQLGSVNKIYLSGGEPFLRDDLPEITQIFYKRNKLEALSIPTNGFNTERVVRQTTEILRRCPSMQLNLNVSLDGFEETHDRIRKLPGGYRHALNTLKELYTIREKYKRLKIGVNTTLMPDNQSEFMLFVAYLIHSEPLINTINADVAYSRMEHGLSKNRSSQLQLSKTEWEKLGNILGGHWALVWKKPLSSLKSFWKAIKDEALFMLYREAELTKKQPVPCKAHKFFSVIRENGDISFCEQTRSIGNVRQRTFGEILKSQEAKDESDSIRHGQCACSQCFFQETNLLSQPYHPKTIRLFFKGFLNLIRK